MAHHQNVSPVGLRALLLAIVAVTLLSAKDVSAQTPDVGDKQGQGRPTLTVKATADLVEQLSKYKADKDIRPEASLLEPSKVLFLPQRAGESESGQQDRLALEVEFNETFFPYQNPESASDRHFGGGVTKLGITPMYRVRIWKENSAPVRTPSFMPKGTFYWDRLQPRAAGHQWGEAAAGSGVFRSIPVHSLAVTVGHHSNGQDGCIFADASGNGFSADDCPSDPNPVYINRRNGSFSTNYGELSYTYRRFRLRPQDERYDIVHRPIAGLWDKERRSHLSWLIGAAYQWHPPFNTMGAAVDKALRPTFGMHRVRVTVGFDKYRGDRSRPATGLAKIPTRLGETSYRFRAWTEITNKTEDVSNCGPAAPHIYRCAPRVSWGADVTVGLFSKIDGLGIYARLMQAQDYYNLSFFQRKRLRFQAGLSMSLSRGRGRVFPVIAPTVLEAEAADPVGWKASQPAIRNELKQIRKAEGSVGGGR